MLDDAVRTRLEALCDLDVRELLACYDAATQARGEAVRALAEIHKICRMGLEGYDALEERVAIQALAVPYVEQRHD